jgi:hypothetical protein
MGDTVSVRMHKPPPLASFPRSRELGVVGGVAGAKVEPKWLADEQVRADPAMLSAL